MNATDHIGSTPHLLLIDDDDSVRARLQQLLARAGYRVQTFSRARAALAERSTLAAPYLVIDYVMPGLDGLETLHLYRSRGWKGRAVLISAYYSTGFRDAALAAGFAAVLAKPVRASSLLEALSTSASRVDANRPDSRAPVSPLGWVR